MALDCYDYDRCNRCMSLKYDEKKGYYCSAE